MFLTVIVLTAFVTVGTLADDTSKDEKAGVFNRLCSLNADWEGEWKGTITIGERTHRVEKVCLSECIACDTCNIPAVRLAFDFKADDLKVSIGYPQVQNHIYVAARTDDPALDATGGPQLILKSFAAKRDGQRLLLNLELRRVFFFAKNPQKDFNVSVVIEANAAKGKVICDKTAAIEFELVRIAEK